MPNSYGFQIALCRRLHNHQCEKAIAGSKRIVKYNRDGDHKEIIIGKLIPEKGNAKSHHAPYFTNFSVYIPSTAHTLEDHLVDLKRYSWAQENPPRILQFPRLNNPKEFSTPVWYHLRYNNKEGEYYARNFSYDGLIMHFNEYLIHAEAGLTSGALEMLGMNPEDVGKLLSLWFFNNHNIRFVPGHIVTPDIKKFRDFCRGLHIDLNKTIISKLTKENEHQNDHITLEDTRELYVNAIATRTQKANNMFIEKIATKYKESNLHSTKGDFRNILSQGLKDLLQNVVIIERGVYQPEKGKKLWEEKFKTEKTHVETLYCSREPFALTIKL